MSWTLNEIASAIVNNVEEGLKGATGYNLPVLQVEREVISERMKICFEVSLSSRLEKQGMMQNIPGIPVDMMEFTKVESISNLVPSKHFVLPKIAPLFGEYAIDYIGPIKRNVKCWKVYTDHTYIDHKFSLAIANEPFVYIDATPRYDGFYDCFLFQYPNTIKMVSFTGILENPTDAETYAGSEPGGEFPAPEWMVNNIIERLTAKYVRTYHKLNYPIVANNHT